MIKRAYIIFWSLIFLLSFSWASAQDYQKLGKEICETISKGDSISKANIFKEFERQYGLDDAKNDLLTSDFNVFCYYLQKEIIKNCSDKLPFIDSYLLVPFSNIADLERIFNNEQTLKLEKQLREIQNKSRLQIIVISTDDYFPQQNIEEYSYSILNKNYSSSFESGGVIFVINPKEGNIRIATNPAAQKRLTDEFCQNIIDKMIIPNFKNKKYYDGIEHAILKIQSKIQ